MRLFFTILLLLISTGLYSEDQNSVPSGSLKAGSGQTGEDNRNFLPLPEGYRSIRLGSAFEEVKGKLEKESPFDFRGDPDVSMQKKLGNTLISCRGRNFIDYGFFQFRDERLYLITLQLNSEKLDFYTMQRNLNRKYGPPARLSPQGMSWENEKVRLSLEYPLTVKYLDRTLFNSILDEGEVRKSFEELSRKKFLEDF